MDYRENSSPYRPLTLIQRGEMGRYSVNGASSTSTDTSYRQTGSDERGRRSERARRRDGVDRYATDKRTAEEPSAEQPARRGARGDRRLTVVSGRDEGSARDTRRRKKRTRGERDLPEEGTLVEEPSSRKKKASGRHGWTMWSRRAANRLSELEDWYGDDEDSLEEPYGYEDDDLGASADDPFAEDEQDVRPWGDDAGWDLKEVRRKRLERRSRESFADRGAAVPDYEVSRDWLYTGEDAGYAGSGRPRQRTSLIASIQAIPGAFVSALGSGFSALGRHPVSIFTVIMMLLTAGMLFAPLRELYVANRKIDTLQATYDQLLEENGNIRHQLEVLQTQEGVENEARERGYVGEGETKVIVEGLEDNSASEGEALSVIAETEIPDTRPWYMVMLDRLFGYDAEA